MPRDHPGARCEQSVHIMRPGPNRDKNSLVSIILDINQPWLMVYSLPGALVTPHLRRSDLTTWCCLVSHVCASISESDSVYGVRFPKAFNVCGASPPTKPVPPVSQIRNRMSPPHPMGGGGGARQNLGTAVSSQATGSLSLDSSFGWDRCIPTQRTLLTWHAMCPPFRLICWSQQAKPPPFVHMELVESSHTFAPSHTTSPTNHPFITTVLVVDAWLTARRSRRESHSLPPGDAYDWGRTHTACMPRPCGRASESWDPLR